MTHMILYRPFLVLFLLGNLFAQQISAATKLTIVSSHWPPYVDSKLPGQGLAVALVNKALQRKGYTSSLHIDNWQRALEGVQIGVFDATCAIWKTPEREQDLLFSQPYLRNKISFIKKKKLAIDYQQLSDLKGFIIGTLRSYAYNDTFTRSREFIKIPANYLVQNLQKLNTGTIDLTLGDERAINYALQEFLPRQADTFELLSPALAYKNLYLAVSKSNTAAQTIINDFNQAIKEMQQDGSYDRIVSQYQY